MHTHYTLLHCHRYALDNALPLVGDNSVLGRSIVIHKANGDRWVCATILNNPTYTYLPPPPPPPSPPPSTETVVLTMTASGSISDYSDTSSLQQKVATAAGVDTSLVAISVAPGSVIITATIAVPAAATAAAVQTSLSSTLGTTADASAKLGITIEDVPKVALGSPPSLDSSPGTLAAATSTVAIGSGPMFWSAIPSVASSYSVAVGDKLSFKYNSYHNVYLMASKAAYDGCDFAGATELASTSLGGGSGGTPNLYEAVVTAAGMFYFACQVSGHCDMGQKVAITVDTAASTQPSPPSTPNSGCTDITLDTGWQMISFNCIDQASSAFDVLEPVPFKSNDKIFSRDGRLVFATYTGEEWVGELVTMGLFYAKGYKVFFTGTAGSVIKQSGDSQLPVEDIVMSAGWNWIGHAPLGSYDINSGIAVVSGQFTVDDMIKTRSGSALMSSSYDGSQFQGELKQLESGAGYGVGVAQAVTFRYLA